MDLTINLSRFVKELETKNRSKFTITAYKKDIEQLSAYLSKIGVKTWEQANTKSLEKYINKLKSDNKLTLKSISRKINSIKTFYKFLIASKVINQNYSNVLKHPKIQRQIPRTLNSFEYKALRDTAKDNLRTYTIIELLLQTGMRIGELSRLQFEDVDLDGDKIIIKEFSSYPSRTIEINPVLRKALMLYVDNPDTKKSKSGFFFSTRTGNQLLIRNIRSAINSTYKKTGIKDASINDLRNTFILYQLENGLKLERLAYTVGHKKISTTENYLDFIESRPNKITTKLIPL